MARGDDAMKKRIKEIVLKEGSYKSNNFIYVYDRQDNAIIQYYMDGRTVKKVLRII